MSSAGKLTDQADQALARGNTREALELAQQALAVEPSFVDAYVTIAMTQQQAGHVDEAKATLRRYLELAPFGRRAETARQQLAALDKAPDKPGN
jgi:predicted TPR repeat methyltransferase